MYHETDRNARTLLVTETDGLPWQSHVGAKDVKEVFVREPLSRGLIDHCSSISQTANLQLRGDIVACLQRFPFLRPSPSRTFQAEGEAKKGSDNDADHKRKKDYDGKRRAEFPHKKRNRDRCCILNGKNDNGCYNKDCYTENKHERPPYSSLRSVLPFIRPSASSYSVFSSAAFSAPVLI